MVVRTAREDRALHTGLPGYEEPKRPWSILGFLAVAALVTRVPAMQPAGKRVAVVAWQVLVAPLLLVGGRGVARSAQAGGDHPDHPGRGAVGDLASATFAGVNSGLLSVAAL